MITISTETILLIIYIIGVIVCFYTNYKIMGLDKSPSDPLTAFIALPFMALAWQFAALTSLLSWLGVILMILHELYYKYKKK